MSRLQKRAKPFVLPLLDGQAITLDEFAQRTIASWATMATMTGEFNDPQKVAIPFAEREHLRLHQEPLTHWRIWIGNYTRHEWVPHWVHRLIPISSPKDVPEVRVDGTARPNTQTTVFVFGQLYVYAVSSQTEIFDEWIAENRDSSILRQIWPVQSATIAWPPVRAMTDIEADRLATAFYDRVTAGWRGR